MTSCPSHPVFIRAIDLDGGGGRLACRRGNRVSPEPVCCVRRGSPWRNLNPANADEFSNPFAKASHDANTHQASLMTDAVRSPSFDTQSIHPRGDTPSRPGCPRLRHSLSSQGQETHVTTSCPTSRSYFDLHVIGIGYLNRI